MTPNQVTQHKYSDALAMARPFVEILEVVMGISSEDYAKIKQASPGA